MKVDMKIKQILSLFYASRSKASMATVTKNSLSLIKVAFRRRSLSNAKYCLFGPKA